MTRADRAVQRSRSRRQETRGAVDIKNVSQGRFRDDVGMVMGEDQYKGYLKNEADYQDAYGKVSSSLKDARGNLDSYNKQISSSQGQLDKAFEDMTAAEKSAYTSINNEWSTFERGFKPLNVVDDKFNVEATYMLPKEVIDDLNKNSFNQDGSYEGTYQDNGQYYVSAFVMGKPYGKELHTSMATAQNDIKSQFYDQNTKAVSAANATTRAAFNESKSALSGANADLEASRVSASNEANRLQAEQNQLNASKKDRDDQRNAAVGQYETAKANRQALFA